MNIERLTILEKALRALPTKNKKVRYKDKVEFNLHGWGFWRTWTAQELGRYRECGSVACACGLATTIPELRAQGLTYSQYDYTPIFAGARSWSATNAFFELDDTESGYLFSEEAYPQKDRRNPLAVARRIRAFVKLGGVLPS